MRALFGKSCLFLCIMATQLAAHPNVNGTWSLQPTKSNFAGEPAMQTGTVTINDRQHHIYISRSFNFDNEAGGFEYSFTTDGQENSSIKNGKAFKSKAKWDDKVLVVKTTREGMTTTERYNLSADGMLVLTVERPGHPLQALYFQRQ